MNEFQPIQFVEASAQTVQNELIEAYQQETGQILYPGDPRRIFLLQMVPILVAMRNDINYTGNQNLLPFAEGDVLDGLGARMGVPRLQSQPARVSMRFTLSTIQLQAVTIPKGTRVTPDGEIYFATVRDLSIAAGQTAGSVTAESIQGGERYNGFVPGQIAIIVDPIPFVASVVNIDTSTGGSDAETDDAYRERQRLAPSTFSVAGPTDAYKFWAKSADVNIVDVAVISPAPGSVDIYPLLRDGGMPDQTVLDKVTAAVSAKDRRPLTDNVSVFPPSNFYYDIELTYYISKERSSEVSAIRAAVEGDAIDQYVAWQHAKLGRAITPDYLMSRMYSAGAHRVAVTRPIYAETGEDEVALLETKSIVYGGLI